MSEEHWEKKNNEIKAILSSKIVIEEVKSLPKDGSSEYTFDNAFEVWTTAIFVDIVDSTNLFASNDKTEVAAIVKAFTSEIVEILNGSNNKVQVGIRGDCVYGIFTTPYKKDVDAIFTKCVEINTLLHILNARIEDEKMKKIYAGIGIATNKETVLKAGKKGSGINDLIWLGSAVTGASKLSGIASRNFCEKIYLSNATYENIIKLESNKEEWFKKDCKNGAYTTNIVCKNGKHLY